MADFPYVNLVGLAAFTNIRRDSKPTGVPVLGRTRLYSMRAKRTSTGNTVRWNVWGVADPTGLYSGVSTSDLVSGSIVVAGQS